MTAPTIHHTELIGKTTPGECPCPGADSFTAHHSLTRYGLDIVHKDGQYWAWRGVWLNVPLELWRGQWGSVVAVPVRTWQ